MAADDAAAGLPPTPSGYPPAMVGQPEDGAPRPSRRAAPGLASETVQYCLETIRKLILEAELLPGEQVHQVALSEKLGVSRVPVREALSVLRSEGVLVYTPNAGYRVARFSLLELKEVYLMRREIEPLLIRSIPEITAPDLEAVKGINQQISAAVRQSGPVFASLNREFHFAIFRLSPYTLILAETERLWNLYEAYSSFYRTIRMHDERTRRATVQEHEEIIAAMSAGDLELLVRLLNRHRTGAQTFLDRLMPAPSADLVPDGRRARRTGDGRPRKAVRT
jgi:DNA-binding GntR family transcriptional regulator